MPPRSKQPEFDITEEEAELLASSDVAANIKKLAIAELMRRLEDPEAAAKLAPTGLLNLVNQILKSEEKAAQKEAEAANEVVDPIGSILSAPLPDDRKLEQFDRLIATYKEQIGKVESEQLLLRRQAEPKRSLQL